MLFRAALSNKFAGFEQADTGPTERQVMILIIILGYLVDGIFFRTIERRLQEKWGLAPA